MNVHTLKGIAVNVQTQRVYHSECTNTEGYITVNVHTQKGIAVNVQTQKGISQ